MIEVPMGRVMRVVVMATVLAIPLSAAGCSIREDAEPRDIQTEVGDFGSAATGDAAVGGNLIYLLTPPNDEGQRRLRAVTRGESGPNELITSLFAGPNDTEVESSLGTAIPAELQLVSASTVGTRLTIDVGTELTELGDDGIRLALAQIVATASELEGIERVRIRVDGRNQAWPTGDGRLVDEELSIYDYPGFLESSQPAFTAPPSA